MLFVELNGKKVQFKGYFECYKPPEIFEKSDKRSFESFYPAKKEDRELSFCKSGI